MRNARSMTLAFLGALLLVAPIVQAQAISAQVLLGKQQQNSKLHNQAKTLLETALKKQGIRAADGIMNPEWTIQLELRRERGPKAESISARASASEAGSSRMGANVTAMAGPFPPNDIATRDQALAGLCDSLAKKLSQQLKQVAAHSTKRGKRFDIQLANAPRGFGPKVKGFLKGICQRSRTGMLSADRGSFTCMSKNVSLQDLEAGLKECLKKAFPKKVFKTQSQGKTLVVVFE